MCAFVANINFLLLLLSDMQEFFYRQRIYILTLLQRYLYIYGVICLAEIISIVNQKGGVGKTTTSHNLSYALAEEGKQTLLIDLDPQMNLSTTLGIDCYAQKNSIYNVLKDKELPLGSVIRETDHDNLSIIPSAFELS